ncbi:MAG: D-alanyl-D-alanine endopeptidase [Methylophilaceae bacterium]|nr:D-alanyl-D-alanine endopeptidase [Methylophilaceae bacterium]
MLRKLLIVCTALTLLIPPLSVAAGQAKHHKNVAQIQPKHSQQKVAKLNKAKPVKLSKSKSVKLVKASKAANLAHVRPESKARATKVSMRSVGRRLVVINSHIRNSQPVVKKVALTQDVFNQAMDSGGVLRLASSKALIINQQTGETLYAKNVDLPTPIASVTKLMTAMVVLDAALSMDENITISDADVDWLKNTSSRVHVGTQLSRFELLQLALMSSENRAASALGRNYPGGITAFVSAMNNKAKLLGMTRTRFVDSSGLDSSNISTAEDLVKMVNAAHRYNVIKQITTTASYQVPLLGYSHPVEFHNTNALVRNSDWTIGISKTGFINEAGRCLVMQAQIDGKPFIIVLLDSVGKYTRIADAQRIRKWIESNHSVG